MARKINSLRLFIGILVLLLLLVVAGCVRKTESNFDSDAPVEVQEVQYDTGIPHVEYTRNGTEYSGVEYPSLVPAMEWLRENTPEGSVVMSWWDYGHMIRGTADREAVIWEPSREIFFTVAKYVRMSDEELAQLECPDCADHMTILDVSNALVSEEESLTTFVMDKHDADYLLVTDQDLGKAYVLLLVSGREPDNFLDENLDPEEHAQDLLFYRAFRGEEIEGLELVYGDNHAKIYQRTEGSE